MFEFLFKILNIPSLFIVFLETKSALNWFEDVKSIGCGDIFF